MSNIHRRLSAVCREKARAPDIVFNCVCSDKCSNRKFLRRWRRCIILGKQNASQQLFNTQPIDNNIT